MSEYEKTPLDDNKLSIFGKKFEGGGTPKLSFSVFKGNPALLVFTNDPNDSEKKPIRAAFDMGNWGYLVRLLTVELPNAQGATEERLCMKRGAPQKLFEDAKIVAGKDSEGVIYIGVSKKGRTAVRFEMMPSMYMTPVDREGNPLDKGYVSRVFTQGYMSLVNSIVEQQIMNTYEPYNPQQNRRGGSGGGGNSQPSAPSSDPFGESMPL